MQKQYFSQDCPACGRHLRIRSEHSNDRVACRHCRAEFMASRSASRNWRAELMQRADELLALASVQLEFAGGQPASQCELAI